MRNRFGFTHSSREKGNFRWWWHAGDRSVLQIELSWRTTLCLICLSTREHSWGLSLAVPYCYFHIGLDGFGLWLPTRESPYTPGLMLPEDREFQISISDWALRLEPWGRSMEWRSKDPWWVRGISFSLREFALGRTTYKETILKAGIPIQIPMPEGAYPAIAEFSSCTWKRPRWFAKTRVYTNVKVPKGVPFQGKGENSWDCGDDGLFGYSSEGHSLPKAIAKGVESVLSSRQRYGNPSRESMNEALTR